MLQDRKPDWNSHKALQKGTDKKMMKKMNAESMTVVSIRKGKLRLTMFCYTLLVITSTMI